MGEALAKYEFKKVKGDLFYRQKNRHQPGYEIFYEISTSSCEELKR